MPQPNTELPHEGADADREIVDRRETAGSARRRYNWRLALLLLSVQIPLIAANRWPRSDPVGPRVLGWVVDNAWGWYVAGCIAFGLGVPVILAVVYGRKR